MTLQNSRLNIFSLTLFLGKIAYLQRAVYIAEELLMQLFFGVLDLISY